MKIFTNGKTNNQQPQKTIEYRIDYLRDFLDGLKVLKLGKEGTIDDNEEAL